MELKGKPVEPRNSDRRSDTESEATKASLPDRPGGPLDIEKEGPQSGEQDWDELGGAQILQDGGSGTEEIAPEGEKDGELPEEDDDNPDQESDEALPDDKEEQAIRHDLGGSGVRYEPE
ncbi:MAG: hypothetical protein ACTHNH_22740 [Mesorhizobium sp.]